jgi:hypothetical protein
MLQSGTAINALPQLASAKVNCRILPGENVDQIKTTLERIVADDQILVTQLGAPTLSLPSPLSDAILGPITKLSAEFFPGAVVLPTMSPGATDGSYLRNAGIPTYGHSGLAGDIHEFRAHGKDERVLVKSFFTGSEYLSSSRRHYRKARRRKSDGSLPEGNRSRQRAKNSRPCWQVLLGWPSWVGDFIVVGTSLALFNWCPRDLAFPPRSFSQ